MLHGDNTDSSKEAGAMKASTNFDSSRSSSCLRAMSTISVTSRSALLDMLALQHR